MHRPSMTSRFSVFFLLAILFLWQAVAHSFEGEAAGLLPPDKAFQLTAASDENHITVLIEAAPGYYLYRDKLRVEPLTPGLTLGAADTPRGEIKEDEFFGKSEILRGLAEIRIPYQAVEGATTVELRVHSQGCADAGICYPPQARTVTVALADMAGPPTPDPAFLVTLEPLSFEAVLVRWEIAPGHYLLKDSLRFGLEHSPGNDLGPPVLPHTDDRVGGRDVYRGEVGVKLPIRRSATAGENLTLVLSWMGGSDTAGDLLPVSQKIEFELIPERIAPTESETPVAPTGLAEQDAIAHRLASGNPVLVVAAFFGFGLLLALTPCVFPMVPILSGLIVGQGRQLTTARAFTLSLVYVLAMSAAFTVAGIVVGLTGQNVQALLQHPWVIGLVALIFALLAASMFGLYEIRVPATLQTRLATLGDRSPRGTLTGAAVMGLLSALIVSPCVTAPLVGALLYIAHTGDAWLGGFALFALGMGMGAPLVAFGTSAGRLLPKAGRWMDSVKAVSGFIMLGIAVWMLERILPPAITLALWGLLLLFAGVWFGAFDALRAEPTAWHRLRKGLALVIALWGAAALVGAAAGGRDLLQPLKGIGFTGDDTVANPTGSALPFRAIKGVAGLETALAELEGRPAMLDVYADWCVSCKELESYTFTAPAVRAALAGAVLLRADVTKNDEADRELLAKLGLFGPPAILFYGRDGAERSDYRLVGFAPAERFAPHATAAFGG